MPRRKREAGAGTIHHVVARGNDRRTIFRDDADRMAFLRRLRSTCDRYTLLIHAYCLMDTHVHVVVQCVAGNLGQAMRFLLGGYAHSFNRRHGRTGHLFEGPFDSRPIESESYLLTAIAYDLLNPVRAGICAHPEDYRWSSYRTLLGSETAPVVDVSTLVLELLTADLDVARRRFAEYVARKAVGGRTTIPA
jgi:putative transposase